MIKIKGLAVTLGISAVALFAIACSNGEASTKADPQQLQASAPVVTAPANEAAPAIGAPSALPETVSAIGAPVAQPAPASVSQVNPAIGAPSAPPIVAPAAEIILPVGAPEPPSRSSGPVAPAQAFASVSGSPSYSGAPLYQTTNGNSGIWVSGQGSITLEPDLALLNLGVDTTNKTVATARAEAATAMNAMITSLKSNGVADLDIQTQFFNISPQYQWTEVFDNGIRTNKQVLTGYKVTNSVSVKIRDMENVGPIMDDVAEAGGDATRINGIKFTVEDTSPLMVQLREEAVADAMAKANQFATLTNVGLGRLMYITESSGGTPQIMAFPEADFARAASSFAPATSISGGELEITMSVQAVFAIQ
jgi:uncharacterized protein YggE